MFSPLTEWWKDIRKHVFESVNISQRLVDDPVLIIAAK